MIEGKKHQPFKIEGKVWVTKHGELFLGMERLKLIKTVIEEGSILAAAKKLKMSYQQAWNIVNQMNHLSPLPIVVTKRGGKDGGGIEITKHGERVILQLNKLEASFEEFLKVATNDFDIDY
jgi:molybdate transport system regulatory protein